MRQAGKYLPVRRIVIEWNVMLERVAGIEPAYSAWKAAALPLSYTRIHDPATVVEGVGFEPT